jgi:hypothetical protein
MNDLKCTRLRAGGDEHVGCGRYGRCEMPAACGALDRAALPTGTKPQTARTARAASLLHMQLSTISVCVEWHVEPMIASCFVDGHNHAARALCILHKLYVRPPHHAMHAMQHMHLWHKHTMQRLSNPCVSQMQSPKTHGNGWPMGRWCFDLEGVWRAERLSLQVWASCRSRIELMQ